MNAKPAVYIETTIPSYLAARPSVNIIIAGKQEVTRQWWEKHRDRFDLFISQYVLDEAAAGNQDAAIRRLEVLKNIDVLEVDQDVLCLTDKIMKSGIIPAKAKIDAAHIAVAARHSVEYLLTWNCTHIANAEMLSSLNYVVSDAGFVLPIICTPDELFGGNENE